MSDDPTSPARVNGILVTYRRPEDLAGSLSVLAAQTRRVDRLIVVDNAVESDLSSVIAEHADAARTIELVNAEDNLGPAGGIALGMRRVLADADDRDLMLVLDDDDPLPDERAVADVVAAIESRRQQRPELAGVGLRGAVMNPSTGRLTKPSMRAGRVDVAYLKSNWAPVYRVDVARQIGVFCAELFFGFDDLEYGLRLNANGHVVEAHELGRVDAQLQQEPSRAYRRAPWRTYYTLRNLLAIYWRYGYRRAALRTAFVLGVAKPIAHVVRGPNRSITQARMAVSGLIDAARGRMGRTVPPETAKTAG